MAGDAYSLLCAWRACMTEPRPSDWEQIVRNLLADTSDALEEEARPAEPPPHRQYKVVDLSYSQDPRQHLKDVRAFHELDGWRLLSVVHLPASGRWLYYLEREAAAEPGPQGGAVTAGAGVPERGAVTRSRLVRLPRLPADDPVVLSSTRRDEERPGEPGPVE